VTLGLQHDVHSQWTLLFGATWTDWSVFESIEVVDPAGAVISLQPEDWNDSWRYSAGFEYAYDPAVVFRLGVEYDATPVPADRLTARIPDEKRYWLATGVTWRVSRRLLVDFAWTHIWTKTYEINDTELTTGDVIESLTGVNPGIGNTLRGDYDAEADVLSIGVRRGY
jgi:long-chain fatty acid transport protein